MLELYEGPFLDGFHGAGGAEFERWIENERIRCEEVAIRAVGKLIDLSLARNEPQEAIAWLRRGRAIDPLDEDITRQLMRLSARLGNRAEAVRSYHLLRRRLRRELELMPSPRTRAVLNEIRAGDERVSRITRGARTEDLGRTPG